MTSPSQASMERALDLVEANTVDLPDHDDMDFFAHEIAVAIDAAVAAEREACAKIADDKAWNEFDGDGASVASTIATAIRVRGEVK